MMHVSTAPLQSRSCSVAILNICRPKRLSAPHNYQSYNHGLIYIRNQSSTTANPSTTTPSPPASKTLISSLRHVALPLAVVSIAAVALAAFFPTAAYAKAKAVAVQNTSFHGSGIMSFILHMPHHLGEIVAKYGTATYAILFAIVFAETGLVVTPFLPGDSLLFATGALVALGKMDLVALLGVYTIAAILGDAVNYAIGNYLGSAALKSRLIKPEYISKTKKFYAKYGGKTVVLARFVPIVRTFAPFVAGIGSMAYSQFAMFNVVGALLWTGLCVGAGYVFGNVPAVHDNFSLVVLGIVAVSLLPLIYEVWAAKKEGNKMFGNCSGSGGMSGRATRLGSSLSATFH